MSTRPKGQLLHRHAKGGWRWAIRFTDHGRRRYLTLGRDADGWTRRRAEDELANVLADVRRDLWVEPGRGSRRRKRRVRDPLFGTFVAQVLDERRGELSEGTLRHHGWCLAHLSRYFSDWRLREIDAETVDEYRIEKVREAEAREREIEAGRAEHDDRGRVMRPLTPQSINRTIDTLQWVLWFRSRRCHSLFEAYASGRGNEHKLFSKADLKKVRALLDGQFSPARQKRLDDLVGKLNEESHGLRLRRVVREDAVPVTDSELQLLTDLRQARNDIVHGTEVKRPPTRDQIHYGIAVVSRMLVHRVAVLSGEGIAVR